MGWLVMAKACVCPPKEIAYETTLIPTMATIETTLEDLGSIVNQSFERYDILMK